MRRVVIWILEDHEDLGFLLQAALSLTHPDVELRLFRTGEEALEASGTPDIIFADTNLAGNLTGPEVVEILRERHRDVAVMFCSSMGPPPPSFMHPRDRALPKPFALAALLREVSLMIAQIPRLQVPHHHRPSRHPHRYKHR